MVLRRTVYDIINNSHSHKMSLSTQLWCWNHRNDAGFVAVHFSMVRKFWTETLLYSGVDTGSFFEKNYSKGWHRTDMLQVYSQNVVFYGRSMIIVGLCDVIQQCFQIRKCKASPVTDYMEPLLQNVPKRLNDWDTTVWGQERHSLC